jgi:hypothetical protein
VTAAEALVNEQISWEKVVEELEGVKAFSSQLNYGTAVQ